MNIKEGTVLLKRYEIVSQVGHGGMSYVYKAKDLKLQRIVALKVLKEEFSEDQDFIKRFNNEAMAAARLNHPSIVAAFDAINDMENGLHFIVMEYVDGESLKTYIRENGHLDSQETIEISLKAAQGIEKAHEAGIIHRDIKPQNILVTRENDVKVADFGIARAATGSTISASCMGSVHYMSPEQARSGYTDERSDIYSLGCTMYEMLTGKVPYSGENSVEVIYAHLNKETPLVGELYPEVSRGLEKAVSKAMQKKPGNRYQTMFELIEDLKMLSSDPEGDFIELPEDNENPGGLYRKIIIGVSIILIILMFVVAVFVLNIFRQGLPARHHMEDSVETVEDQKEIINISALDTMLPNILGMTMAEAEEYLSDYSIKTEERGEEFSEIYNEGVIISYDENVSQGGILMVTVSKGSGNIIFYDPALKDMTALQETPFQDLKKRLDERGIAYIESPVSSETVPEGNCVSASKPDTQTEGPLIIEVSRGSDDYLTNVPDITGITEQEALEMLKDLSLKQGMRSYAPSDTQAGLIVSQTPSPGEIVKKDSYVDMTISSGQGGDSYILRPDIGESEEMEKEYWYSSVNTVVFLDDTEDVSDNGNILVLIRLCQNIDGTEIYTTLQNARSYSVGSELQVVFPKIRGEAGIPTGRIEVVNASLDQIIAAVDINFSPAE